MVLFSPQTLRVASRVIASFSQTTALTLNAEAASWPSLLTRVCNSIPPAKAFLRLLIKEPFADSQAALRPARLSQMINVS